MFIILTTYYPQVHTNGSRTMFKICSYKRLDRAFLAQRAPPGPEFKLPPTLGQYLGLLFKSMVAESTLFTGELAKVSPIELIIVAGEFSVDATKKTLLSIARAGRIFSS